MSLLGWLFMQCLSFTLLINFAASQDNRQTFIVYMGNQPEDKASAPILHMSMLQRVVGSNIGPDHLVRSYRKSFHGFAAKLTDEEAQKMAGMEGVVSVFPSGKKKIQTTKSWDFIGLPQQVQRATNVESDVIIGVIDTGIWPESESFSDNGFGPPPSKWKGHCQASLNFTCNNKIIGARYYKADGKFGTNDIKSPRDTDGHGSHCASIAAGNMVSKANLYGLASGTARGGVPSARIAVYKVCWTTDCNDVDILAAFEDAIQDGVDILSISLASQASNYFEDAIAIGAFHAMRNGILTSVAAGNDGPSPSTIVNIAPWFISVAASTIDRKFSTKVQLGNNKVYEGISINTYDLENVSYPLIYGRDAANSSGGFTNATSRFCSEDSLDRNLVKGKIVICDALNDGDAPLQAGAVGAVMRGQIKRDTAFSFPLPTSYVHPNDGSDILLYMNSTRNATATIFRSTEGYNNALAPFVASFSSRGPNPITFDILKPDISAPGVDILAAWSLLSTVSQVEGDTRTVPYNIISGTSMACPHVTGAAAYIKSFHPTWSPSAIKSALMTTATTMSSAKNLDAEFAYGSGELSPVKALNPGLVYDAETIDYIKFLCGQGYTTTLLRLVAGGDKSSTCSETTQGTVSDLNYPSFALSISSQESNNISPRVYKRVVTNVGSPASTYRASITAPAGLRIRANPDVLSFTSLGQKLSFNLTIEGTMSNLNIVSASLLWVDGVHQVRSPIVVYMIS